MKLRSGNETDTKHIFPFLRLPPELRNMIYAELFYLNVEIPLVRMVYPERNGTLKGKRTKAERRKWRNAGPEISADSQTPYTAIMGTCKQLYQETKEISSFACSRIILDLFQLMLPGPGPLRVFTDFNTTMLSQLQSVVMDADLIGLTLTIPPGGTTMSKLYTAMVGLRLKNLTLLYYAFALGVSSSTSFRIYRDRIQTWIKWTERFAGVESHSVRFVDYSFKVNWMLEVATQVENERIITHGRPARKITLAVDRDEDQIQKNLTSAQLNLYGELFDRPRANSGLARIED